MTSPGAPGINRQILALAVPAVGALLAEPAFLLADAAIIGHVGTSELAGVALASVLLGTVVGLAIFLAYGTTAAVARSVGAGDRRSAMTFGVAGLYLALGLGVIVAAGLAPLASWLIRLLGGTGTDATFGTTYVIISLIGLPAMLLVLAATGALRGVLDMRSPLIAAVVGAMANVVLNVILVLGLGWGVAGAAIGTVLAQCGMAAYLVAKVWRAARSVRAPLRPEWRRVGLAGKAGLPLLIRTASLRAAIIMTTMVAAGQGTDSLAAHHIVMSIWNFLALALDGLAIAAQALTGKALGEGDGKAARALTGRMLTWGVLAGAVIGVAVILLHTVAGSAFSPDAQVRAAVAGALIVLALAQPISGWVFVLDGVLIGAGDAPYLAWVGLINVAVYIPALWAVAALAPGGAAGLMWLWAAYAGAYMLARAITLGLRYHGDRWLRLGSTL